MKSIKFPRIQAVSLAAILLTSMVSCDDSDVIRGLECNPSNVEVEVGDVVSVDITGGVAPFSVVSSDEDIATAEIDGSTLSITGVNVGESAIYVYDANGLEGSVDVIVKEPVEYLDFDKNSLSLHVGDEESVTVSGGVAPYTATVNDENIATAIVDEDIVTIKGIGVGSADIIVTDSNDKTGLISISITE